MDESISNVEEGKRPLILNSQVSKIIIQRTIIYVAWIIIYMEKKASILGYLCS